MSTVLTISEAASLGLHSSVLLAATPGRRRSNRELAAALGASEAHLAKVMRRLVRAGVVGSLRGPRGGFSLVGDPGTITLLRVYEAVDGPLTEQGCLLETPVCAQPGGSCVLGGLLAAVGAQIRAYLAETSLADLAGVFGSDPEIAA